MFDDLMALRDHLAGVLTHFNAKEFGKGIKDAGEVLVIIGNTVDQFDGGGGPTTMALPAGPAKEGKLDAILAEIETHCTALMPTAAFAAGINEAEAMPPGLAGLDLTGLDPSTIALILQLLQTFGPIVLAFIKKIIARRQQHNA